MMTTKKLSIACILLMAIAADAPAENIVVEAESFARSSAGWKVFQNVLTRAASDLKALNGATGDPKATAHTTVEIPSAATYRIWVRHSVHETVRGPFRLAVSKAGRPIAEKVFDQSLPSRQQRREIYIWDAFDVALAAGECRLTLTKHQQQNCRRIARNVDCVVLTPNLEFTPDHTKFGPQTWIRVTLADIYEKPVYVHIFADRHRAPYYAHWHISKAGPRAGLQPPRGQMLDGGEQTSWCNITPMLFRDHGAILNISARHGYQEWAERLQARFEFATEPDESTIVRTVDADCQPNGLVVVMPPDLTTAVHRQRFGRDLEFAQATGRIADSFPWPTIGRKPKQIPFIVNARFGRDERVDQRVLDREWKTLDYFGFCNRDKQILHGRIWPKRDTPYCVIDVESMRTHSRDVARKFFDSGNNADDIAVCLLTDEPSGQTSSFMAKEPAYHIAFRDWLKELGKTPDELGTADWNSVKPVDEADRDRFPRLHCLTQRFRTRVLGDLMAAQRNILEDAYGRKLPVAANFSDGATYQANFYAQGIDYFELLDSDDQNTIWGEDWANQSSSDQCGAYNVDLMRAAARDRRQTIGHHLIAHAHRRAWDIKTKAASETARGVRIWNNFCYGPGWSRHEGGPVWQSHAWYHHPETWRANAEVVREIGGAEDLLADAVAMPAEVAILYSSSSDAWMLKRNRVFGFERMHTWMALAHAQIPVDFVAERQVERGDLDDYRVCYFTGPNLTQSAAEKLRRWVHNGGTLFLTAGAAMRDEFNQPLTILDDLLPAQRAAANEFEPFYFSGGRLSGLRPAGRVAVAETEINVLSTRQQFTAKAGSTVSGRFRDGSPALVRGAAGNGTVFCAGFLPAVDYIHKAQHARLAGEGSAPSTAPQSEHPAPPVTLAGNGVVVQQPQTPLERSRNPWEFPADVRDVILTPVRTAAITPPLRCNVPLVDALPLHCDRGIVIPLANHTLEPLATVTLNIRVSRPINRVESVHQGRIEFRRDSQGDVQMTLPLGASDYVKLYY